jgi:hypothetical protein
MTKTAKIDVDDRYKKTFFQALARHPAIEEIDNHGMDDGRFFVHLKPNFRWYPETEDHCTMSFGSISEARQELKWIVEVTPTTVPADFIDKAAEASKQLKFAWGYVREMRGVIQNELVAGRKLPRGLKMLGIDEIDDLFLSYRAVDQAVKKIKGAA